MALDYQKYVDGLSSSDPQTLLDSALWFVNTSDRQYYVRASEILCKAASCDPECIKYIAQKTEQDPIFLTQLCVQVLQESKDEEVKQTTIALIEWIIDTLKNIKNESTEIIAQVYSSLQETGNPSILAKSKELL